MFDRRNYELKYNEQFHAETCTRHRCFTFIKTEDNLNPDETKTCAQRFLQSLTITELASRVDQFIKYTKRKYRERKRRHEAEINEIEYLAQNPSSEISQVGSIYSEFDVQEEAVQSGQVMLGEIESDFDLRMQAKILSYFQPKKVGHRKVVNIHNTWEILYEEQMTRVVLTWKTRTQCKGNRDSMVFSEKWRRFVKAAMQHGRSHIVFSETEFYLCLLLYEFNMSQLVCFGHAFNIGGIVPAVFIYILISFFIQMPFNMWIISMVSYSKKLSLRLFTDCMPLVSAIRYPIFLAFVIAESRRLMNLEAVVKFMYLTLIKDEVWKNCTLPPLNEHCVPYYTNLKHNVNCSADRNRDAEYEYFSTQYYVQYNVFHIGNVGDESSMLEQWGDAAFRIYSPVLGLISFLIASNGIAMLKKLTIKLQIFVILLAAICVFSVAFDRISAISYQWNYVMVDVKFVVNFISLSLQINSLPILMWLASMKPPELNPATCCVVFQSIKFLVLFIMSTTYGVLANSIAQRYNMVNINCFTLEGNDIVFAMAPDFFATFRFSKIWQASWMLCMLLIAVIYSVYMILAASDSLIQIIPNGDSYATLFMFLVTVAVVCFRLVNEFPNFYKTLVEFELRGLNYINNFNFGAVVLCIYFLYTPVRFSHEYEFVFGTPPARFWIIAWHYMVYIALLVLILTLVDLSRVEDKVLVQYIIAGIFIVCALWLLVCNCIKLSFLAIKQETLQTLFYPSKRWGPPTRAERMEQMRLERRKRLDMRFVCRHKCFINSEKFEEVEKYQRLQVKKLQDLQKTAIYQWFIRETALKTETVQFFNSSLIED